MSKGDRLQDVRTATIIYRERQRTLDDAQEAFYGALLAATDDAPASEKLTQEEVARATEVAVPGQGYNRGRIAQLLVAARKWRRRETR